MLSDNGQMRFRSGLRGRALCLQAELDQAADGLKSSKKPLVVLAHLHQGDEF
jgi:hypothetical protein